jgi:hypothetical protein
MSRKQKAHQKWEEIRRVINNEQKTEGSSIMSRKQKVSRAISPLYNPISGLFYQVVCLGGSSGEYG